MFCLSDTILSRHIVHFNNNFKNQVISYISKSYSHFFWQMVNFSVEPTFPKINLDRSTLENVHMPLRRICILVLLNGLSYISLWGHLAYSVIQIFSISSSIFCLAELLIVESGVWILLLLMYCKKYCLILPSFLLISDLNRCFNVTCKYSYNCYFLCYLPHHHYIVTIFVSCEWF